MIFKFLGVFAMLAHYQIAQAVPKFLEARTAADVMNYLRDLPEGTKVFADIDDTFITPSSKTFRAPPYNKLIDVIKKNKDKYANYQEIVSNWRLQRKVMLIDNDWPLILEMLKAKHKVYGLTKMDTGKFGNIESMEKWRYQELRSLGIEFSDNTELPESINGAAFYKGIFITGDNSKSQTLSYYLKYLQPQTIVLIDDRQEHLEDIEKFCQKHAIAFKGILFNGLEKFKDKPDPAVALFQRQYLIKHAQWLEDDVAADRMKKDHTQIKSRL
jgi:hypothetical protein